MTSKTVVLSKADYDEIISTLQKVFEVLQRLSK